MFPLAGRVKQILHPIRRCWPLKGCIVTEKISWHRLTVFTVPKGNSCLKCLKAGQLFNNKVFFWEQSDRNAYPPITKLYVTNRNNRTWKPADFTFVFPQGVEEYAIVVCVRVTSAESCSCVWTDGLNLRRGKTYQHMSLTNTYSVSLDISRDYFSLSHGAKQKEMIIIKMLWVRKLKQKLYSVSSTRKQQFSTAA